MEPLLKVSPSPITPLVPIFVLKNQNIVLKSPFDTVYALIKITKTRVSKQKGYIVFLFLTGGKETNNLNWIGF